MTTKDTPEVRRLKARVAMLERAISKMEEGHAEREHVREKIFGLRAQPAKPVRWAVREKSAAGKLPSTPVLILSDWHAGERVRAEETGGLNAFSADILRRRVATILYNALHLIDHHHNGSVDGVVLPILGDMVTGEIHDELTRTNDRGPLLSVLLVRDLLHEVIRVLANKYGRTFVPCVAGNHGRMDRKPQAKSFMERNLDWLIYTMLERDFATDTRITFYTPLANEAAFDIHGVRFLATHGHDLGVKGGDGIIGSVGPIMRGRVKIGQQRAAMGDDFDMLLIGHWHQYMILPGVVVNNSLKGYDEYAAKVLRARPAPPSQALFFVHPKRGIVSHWQVAAQDVVPGALRGHGKHVTFNAG